MDENWRALLLESEFPAEGKYDTVIQGWHVLVVKSAADFHALNDRCTHQAAQLSAGRVRRGALMCPVHGARFDISTGRCVGGAYKDLRSFPLRVRDGVIEIALPSHAPSIEDLPIPAP